MKVFICNAFSLSMLDRKQQGCDQMFGTILNGGIRFPRIPRPVDDPAAFIATAIDSAGAEIESSLGHAATQGLFESILGIDCPINRTNVHLTPDAHALVGQYIGPRLEEGATKLPEGARIEWWLI